MKNNLFILFLLLLTTLASAQKKVKIKKDKVFIDGKHVLKYEKASGQSSSIYTLNDDEILFIKYSDNETSNYNDDDYLSFNFLGEDIVVETSDLSKVPITFSTRKFTQGRVKW
jgi:hypothetical protein